jgi:hypothetical protein
MSSEMTYSLVVFLLLTVFNFCFIVWPVGRHWVQLISQKVSADYAIPGIGCCRAGGMLGYTMQRLHFCFSQVYIVSPVACRVLIAFLC